MTATAKECININDTCCVVLTQTGANRLNSINKKANDSFLLRSGTRLKVDHKENDTYKNQLWFIMQVFGEDFQLGLEAPFLDLTLYFT